MLAMHAELPPSFLLRISQPRARTAPPTRLDPFPQPNRYAHPPPTILHCCILFYQAGSLYIRPSISASLWCPTTPVRTK